MAVPLAAHRHRLIRRLTGDITVFHGLLTVFRGGGATFPVAGKGGTPGSDTVRFPPRTNS
ncbi:hypothetical protein BHE74_00038164, partial [Ensete ventricosum]